MPPNFAPPLPPERPHPRAHENEHGRRRALATYVPHVLPPCPPTGGPLPQEELATSGEALSLPQRQAGVNGLRALTLGDAASTLSRDARANLAGEPCEPPKQRTLYQIPRRFQRVFRWSVPGSNR